MDRKSEAGPLCGRCGERRPLVTVTGRSGQAALCETCLPDALGGLNRWTGVQAATILRSLLQPRVATESTTLPPSDSRAECARCGLTYAEFQKDGRAGCASCYIAFAPAVRHALAVLHGEKAF